MPIDEHRRLNYENWEDRVSIHAASQTYDLTGLASDPTRLTRVIERDRERLPGLSGKNVVHLQCHIGTDTLSLARLGAASVSGYDFSPSALEVARKLASDAGVDITYVEGEFYDALDLLGRERFDVVYTGAGAINWLPDIRGWARVVARPDLHDARQRQPVAVPEFLEHCDNEASVDEGLHDPIVRARDEVADGVALGKFRRLRGSLRELDR